jgi:hypothetical protein
MPTFNVTCLKPFIHVMCNEFVAKVLEYNDEGQCSIVVTNTSTTCEWEGTTYGLDKFMECMCKFIFLSFPFKKLPCSIFPSSIQNVPFT